MWREFLLGITPNVRFFDPAKPETLERAETTLGIAVPEELREFLSETDGLDETSVEEWPLHLVWSVNKIVRENREIRTAFKDANLDGLLFFSAVGISSILIAFSTDPRSSAPNGIVAWYPIGDERPIIAPSLRDYLQGWLSNQLKL